MIVVDASAVIELLLGRASAPSIARRVAASDGAILAPHLITTDPKLARVPGSRAIVEVMA